MPELKCESKLPEAPDCGFDELDDATIERKARTHGRFVTITIWDVAKGAIDFDTGERTYKMRARSVEVMTDADRDQALAMHDRIHGVRTGEITLAAAGEPE